MTSRLAPAALVAALLVATSAAFVVTEAEADSEPDREARVDKIFSPTCDCATDSAEIAFRLGARTREPQIIDSGGDVVRELARSRPQGRTAVAYVWDGRDGNGQVVAEGLPTACPPRPAAPAIVMPNPIRVDVTPPRIEASPRGRS
jgi:hypothetical protein